MAIKQKEFKGQGCYYWITLGSPQLNISVKCDTIKEESHTKNQRYNYFSNKDVADNLYKELIDLLIKYGVKIYKTIPVGGIKLVHI
jgi:hypothetical protein